MDWRREVAFAPPRIARLKPSRSIRFTNLFTEPALCGFPTLPTGATTYPGLSFIPSPVAHPYESSPGREPGPADRARRRAVAIPGSPPGRRPETLVGEEFVHRGDLGVVAGEGELGQAPRVLDGPQHRVVVVGDIADEVTRPAGVDHHRGHQRAAEHAARPAGADVRVTLGQYGGVAAAGRGVPAAVDRVAGEVALVGHDEDRAVPRPRPAGHDRGHRALDEGVGLVLEPDVVRVVVGAVERAGRLRVTGYRGVHPAVHVVALIRRDVHEPGCVRAVQVAGQGGVRLDVRDPRR